LGAGVKIFLALVGAFGGLWSADVDNEFFALLAGAVVGWLLGMIIDLRDRAEALERKIGVLERFRQEVAAREPGITAKAAPTGAPSVAPGSRPEAAPTAAASGVTGGSRPEAAPTAATSGVAGGSRPEAVPTQAAPAKLAPTEPGLIERAFAYARDWLLSGNVPVKVGVIISFFGVAFLLKYAVDEGILSAPIELRLAAIAAGAIAMLVIGWRVRAKNRIYALSIQGGGVGIIYLTVFAAFRLYSLLPPTAAFALLIALTAASAALAVLQRAQPLAVLGTVGGFLAPILVSTGTGNHVALFSYYLVLNLAVVGIAWFMAWRFLNIVGFAFTFVIGGIWGAKFYKLENFATVEPFLLAYFAIYLAVAVLFALRHGPEKGGFVDGSLVFGLPVVAFAYQMELVEPYAHARAASAVAAALVYGGLASWLLRRNEDGARLLCEACLALAVGFATIAVPLALDAQWTAAAWALEGAGLVWVGLRQSRVLAQAAGVALQVVAGAVLVNEYRELSTTPVLLNGRTLGGAMLAVATFYSGAVMQRLAPDKSEPHALGSLGLVLIGTVWWYFTGLQELETNGPTAYSLPMAVVFCAASAAAFHGLALCFAASRLNLAAATLTPLLVWGAIAWADVKTHPSQDFGFLAWPAALATQLWLADRLKAWHAVFANVAALASLWLAAALLAWDAHWALGKLAPYSVWAWTGAVAALALAGHVAARFAPGTRFDSLAGWGAAVPLFAALVIAIAFQLNSRGDPRPLPYIPLANPLDLATLAVAGALLLWYRAQGAVLKLASEGDRPAWFGLAALGFVVVTMTTVRTFVHWAEVPHDYYAIMRSDGVQAALSIVWATLGVSAMFGGARSAKRAVWVAGAVLMGVVVGKLFLIDLGSTGTVARIVSFIGVGVLLLVIGWFAPLPARAAEATR
jgi:uncharacterized membrane protein